jgi:hypothetical protein
MRSTLAPWLLLFIAGCDNRYYPLGTVPDGGVNPAGGAGGAQAGGAGGSPAGGKLGGEGGSSMGGAGGSAIGGEGGSSMGGAGGSAIGGEGGPSMGGAGGSEIGGEGGPSMGAGGSAIGGEDGSSGGAPGSGNGGGGGASSGGVGGSVAACSMAPAPLPERGIKLSPKELAFRLASFVWGQSGDDALVNAVSSATTTTDVQRLARAMFADKRFYAGIQRLMRGWLGYQAAFDYPGANQVMMQASVPELRASMVAETDTFLQDLLFTGDGQLSTMLLSSYTFVNAQVAPLYGLSAPMLPGFQVTSLDKNQRSGILTQPSFLFVQDSIPKRGRWVRDRLLCNLVPPPPVQLPVPQPNPGETGRQALERNLEAAPVCRACHTLIDPIGFGFENYDAIGRWRDSDNGQPVDASGVLPALDGGKDQAFLGARQLGEQLVGSCEAIRCVASTFLAQGLARDLTMSDQTAVDELTAAFIRSGLNLRELFALTAATIPFLAPAP